jgi:hypothetical protein
MGRRQPGYAASLWRAVGRHVRGAQRPRLRKRLLALAWAGCRPCSSKSRTGAVRTGVFEARACVHWHLNASRYLPRQWRAQSSVAVGRRRNRGGLNETASTWKESKQRPCSFFATGTELKGGLNGPRFYEELRQHGSFVFKKFLLVFSCITKGPAEPFIYYSAFFPMADSCCDGCCCPLHECDGNVCVF